MKEKIQNYLNNSGKIFISGSYIGSDLYLKKNKSEQDKKFANEILKYKLDSDHAVKKGEVVSADKNFLSLGNKIEFITELNEKFYNAEAPDAIGNINGSKTLLKYTENLYSAAIGYKSNYGIVAMGFPFETIKTDAQREILMRAILKFLGE